MTTLPLAATLLRGNALLALGAALTWGGGDFAGGMGVKRGGGSFAAALHVVLLSHGASLLALLGFALLRGDPLPGGAPLLWSLLAGLLGASSVLTFYVCLARGAMGVSAAISGVLAAAIPSAVSIALEGFPGPLRFAGFALALVAIWLIAGTAGGIRPARGILALSVLAGAGFGFYFVALRMAGTAGVVWSLALTRSVSVSVCLLALVWRRLQTPKPDSATDPHLPRQPSPSARPRSAFRRSVVGWSLATSLLDTAGNLLFVSATRAGRLDVASVLASLYPASTILLAAWLLGERPDGRQGLGMALAATAVVLITF